MPFILSIFLKLSTIAIANAGLFYLLQDKTNKKKMAETEELEVSKVLNSEKLFQHTGIQVNDLHRWATHVALL